MRRSRYFNFQSCVLHATLEIEVQLYGPQLVAFFSTPTYLDHCHIAKAPTKLQKHRTDSVFYNSAFTDIPSVPAKRHFSYLWLCFCVASPSWRISPIWDACSLHSRPWEHDPLNPLKTPLYDAQTPLTLFYWLDPSIWCANAKHVVHLCHTKTAQHWTLLPRFFSLSPRCHVHNEVKLLNPARITTCLLASAPSPFSPAYMTSFFQSARQLGTLWETPCYKPVHIYWHFSFLSSLRAHLSTIRMRYNISISISLWSGASRLYWQYFASSLPHWLRHWIILPIGFLQHNFTVWDRRSCSPFVAHFSLYPDVSPEIASPSTIVPPTHMWPVKRNPASRSMPAYLPYNAWLSLINQLARRPALFFFNLLASCRNTTHASISLGASPHINTDSPVPHLPVSHNPISCGVLPNICSYNTASCRDTICFFLLSSF